jgi:sensitive to high expression protein 9, mitochondrial
MSAARSASRQAKATYDSAVIRRSNSQREVNELLQRKSSWADSDVSHFAVLIRRDHAYEQEETSAKYAVRDTEEAVEREFGELMRSILARYHEEQIWSDKIRSVSTYGSLMALGLNLLVFMMAVVVVEPWKRRKLTQAFEDKTIAMSLENGIILENGLREIEGYLEEQRKHLSNMALQLKMREDTASIHRVVNAKDVGQVVIANAIVIGLAGWLVRWLSSG